MENSGVACAVISAICLGSCYVPLKPFHRGDGLYFQWVQSVGQLMVGVVVAILTSSGTIIPIATLNGVLFAIGNCLTIYIMNGIGMATGYLIWNTVACLVGWGITRFGLFGNPIQIPKCDWMNLLGVATICFGGVIYSRIKHVSPKVRPPPWIILEEGESKMDLTEEEEAYKNSSSSKRVLCLWLTVIVGCCYGNFFTPINYILHYDINASQDYRTYLFSYCIGSFFTSTTLFFLYSIFKKNVPLINPELSLPSLISGILYGIGIISFLISCKSVDQVILYPIISKAPGIVVSLWAIFLFREIRGKMDILKLFIGISITLIGILLISLSKV